MSGRTKLAMALVSVLFLLAPGRSAWGNNFSQIIAPAKFSTVDCCPTEIAVRMLPGANASTFHAWLNFRNITGKFVRTGDILKALVTEQDGLVVCVDGGKSSKCWHVNLLIIEVAGQKRKLDVDSVLFRARRAAPQNHAPTARAGDDQTVQVGRTVYPDGSASTDPDGDLLTYLWDFTQRPSDSSANIIDPTVARPSFEADKPGTYELQLIVNDGKVYSTPDTVLVSTENSPPVAKAGPDQTAPVGARVELNGWGSTDVDGDSLFYEWMPLTVPNESKASLSDPASPTPFFLVDKPGTYQATLIVNDGNFDSAPDTVDVTTVNSPPVAKAGDDQKAYQGDVVVLDGSGSSDVDGDPLTYKWSFTTLPSGSNADLTGPTTFNPTFEVDEMGDYVAQLIVNDGTADSKIPDTVTISALKNVRPVANAGTNQEVSVNLPVNVDGSGSSDADGDSLTYRWSFTSKPTGSAAAFANPVACTTTFVPDVAGPYIVQLIVNDGYMDSIPKTVTITGLVDDLCPDDPLKTEPGICGCGKPDIDIDSDGDGVLNCNDGCPSDPNKVKPGACGCGTPDTDTDGDGTSDCSDGCPSDPNKVAPGACGCGVPDTDTDGDGTPDCNDGCPSDPNKTAPGACDCGVADTDSDGDGIPDCHDSYPNDPTNATLLDASVVTTLNQAGAFLHTGTNPLQTGVALGTIETRRAAVLRGKVLTRDGAPLPGVAVSILDHPEYGQTLSRQDGMFDLAVNGGGPLTVNYRKSNHLPAQRQTDVNWQQYHWLPEIVLVRLDDKFTKIEFSDGKPMQVGEGSAVTDADGTRQARVLFPQGTQAQLVKPDGSTEPMASLTFRATEYTVGPNGPKAMPAPLPPTSNYTYAVELSADEALAEGASASFTQPVFFYLDNFLKFPVGTQVPLAYYDRIKAAWVPVQDGRVIKILAEDSGLAQVDTDGDNATDNALGLTDEERAQLALLYSPGKSLQRAAITHFTAYDPNYGASPVEGAERPQLARPGGGAGGKLDWDCLVFGSLIECSNQVLNEEVGITGTPYTLNYSSERVPGNQDAYTLEIPVSGSTIPSVLKRIDLHVEVAGQRHDYTYAPATNLSQTFTWDGLDGYGRKVYGPQTAKATIDYIYDGYYTLPMSLSRSFGFPSGVRVPGDIKARDAAVLSQSFQKAMGAATRQDLGGWSMNIHHLYDPIGRTLYLGSGGRRSATNLNTRVMYTVAGTGPSGYSGDDGKATQAKLYAPEDVVVAPDGSFYIADTGNHRIRHIAPDGTITTVAGTGNPGTAGDGGPALAADLYYPAGLALGPDGSLYLAFHFDPKYPENQDPRIRRMKDGIITTVAGTGVFGYSGDGGPATAAQLNGPCAVAATNDGTLYIADSGNHRIRRVAPDGTIATFAGTGGCGINSDVGDNGPAMEAELCSPTDLAVGPDGSVNFVDGKFGVVRRISPDGIITSLLDVSPLASWSPDKNSQMVAASSKRSQSKSYWEIARSYLGVAPAYAWYLESFAQCHLAVAGDGTLYVTTGPWDYNINSKIVQLDTNGDSRVIAGGGFDSAPPEGAPATDASLQYVQGFALAPDGSIVFAQNDDATNHSVLRRIVSPMPGLGGDEIVIAGAGGEELYIFNASGRHLRTVHSLTGGVLYQFLYNSDGQLVKIVDGDDDVTTIERGGSGNPEAIVSPYGQRTTLGLDASGFLSVVTNPANETEQFTYSQPGGLLATRTDAESLVYQYTYDAMGRMAKEDNPANGSLTLTRTVVANGHEVTKTTAMGRTSINRVERLATGEQVRTNILPDGTQSVVRNATDGSTTARSSTGMQAASRQAPDPRFGMQAPFTAEKQLTTPSGLTMTTANTRTATLAEAGNPLSLDSLTETYSRNGRTYQQVYDANTKTFVETSPMGLQTTRTIDARGRLLRRQEANLNPVSYTYNAHGQTESITWGEGSEARTTTFAYHASTGFPAQTTDALERITSYQYDPAGRLTTRVLPGNLSIGYAYDRNGNVVMLTTPRKPSHTFSYSAANLVQQYLPPAVAGSGSTATAHEYNLDQQLTLSTLPDGLTFTVSYDSAGRFEKWGLSEGDILFGYDGVTGQLASITTPSGIGLAFTYDGDAVTGTTWTGTVSGTVNTVYDNNFWLTQLSVNGGSPISYGYDNDGRLVQAGALTVTRQAENGLISHTQLNNITDPRTYNGFGEMTTYRAQRGGTDFFSMQFSYDKLGRIAERTETVGGSSSTWTYTYDAADRLAGVSRDGAVTAGYEYDANNNRTRFTDSGGVSITGTFDDQDRLLTYGSNSYTYTANGELRSKISGTETTTYRYDVLGNLTRVVLPAGSIIDYLVDGQGRRVGKKVAGTLVQGFLYQDITNPVAELDQNNQVVALFVYGTRPMVPDYMVKGGTVYRIIADQLGSVRLVVDSQTGTVAQRMDYDEFGRILLDTNPGFQPFGFAGGLYDGDTGLIRLGARDYDPETGRWTARDPLLFAGGQTNLYTYVDANPVRRIDPTGTNWLADWWKTQKEEAWNWDKLTTNNQQEKDNALFTGKKSTPAQPTPQATPQTQPKTQTTTKTNNGFWSWLSSVFGTKEQNSFVAVNTVANRLLTANPNSDIVGGFLNQVYANNPAGSLIERGVLKDLIGIYAKEQARGDAEKEKQIKEMLDDCF